MALAGCVDASRYPPAITEHNVARLKPSIRPTETYTEPNFVRVHTAQVGDAASRIATIEHLCYSAVTSPAGGRPGWRCQTIVDGEAMSREDALFIARNYALQNDIPVIYECHSD
jgi:hypothetical protein